MSRMIFNVHGQPQALGELMAKGGEAEIYPLRYRPDVLFKAYHDAVLKERGQDLEKKIKAMREIDLRKNRNLSWPLLSVYDQNKRWIGYCMYRGSGVEMFKLAHAMLYKKYFPNLDRVRIVEYLISFLHEVRKLHKKKIFIGDYNLQNILLDPQSSKVTLIDCDSYQIRVGNERFPCAVGSADMTPKEHQNKNFKDVVRNVESELFSIAIILFKALMLGRHPYDVVGGEDPVKNLCKGGFPYGQSGRGIPKGPWYNIWSHMPYKIKSLFIQTFTEGADHPDKRIALDKWLDELRTYKKEIEKGWHATEIVPAKPKESKHHNDKVQADD